MLQLAVGQTLVEHGQVVAEIQEGLHGVAFRQRASADVIDVAVRHTTNSAATNAQPPAKVYLLIVGKEAGIESACLPVVLGTYHECSACSPEHVLPVVILAFITFYGIKNAPAAEGIAVTVKISPTRSGILKTVAVKDGEQLGLAGCHLRV